MSKIVEIQNLSKKYLIYHENRGAYATLVETLAKKAKHAFQSLCHPIRSTSSKAEKKCEEFWSLKDINFDIEEGDRVGIIGRNGAGKSTLLKVISRITEPTTGRISIRGKVSSLLEVGTGFHPELSGRENIFLNGAILGMPYQEIKRKFDEIVAFAEVEKFLDTPVKQFSSGMHTRLGFAIAAHLDPDLLIVDEVLAVGDIQFQEKCLKKLNDLSSNGRTVLFVSHDVGAIVSLCNKGIFLEKGQLKEFGPIDRCISSYMRSVREQTLSWKGNEGDEHIRVYGVSLEGGQPGREFFYRSEKARIKIEYEVVKPSADLIMGIGVWNHRNQLLASSHTSDHLEHYNALNKIGKRMASFMIDTDLFREGEYSVKLDCSLHNRKKIISDEIALKLQVYAQTKQTRFHSTAKEGLLLGNQWELD